MIDFDFSFLERTFARECVKKFVLQSVIEVNSFFIDENVFFLSSMTSLYGESRSTRV